jgi:hypothetical protein
VVLEDSVVVRVSDNLSGYVLHRVQLQQETTARIVMGIWIMLFLRATEPKLQQIHGRMRTRPYLTLHKLTVITPPGTIIGLAMRRPAIAAAAVVDRAEMDLAWYIYCTLEGFDMRTPRPHQILLSRGNPLEFDPRDARRAVRHDQTTRYRLLQAVTHALQAIRNIHKLFVCCGGNVLPKDIGIKYTSPASEIVGEAQLFDFERAYMVGSFLNQPAGKLGEVLVEVDQEAAKHFPQEDTTSLRSYVRVTNAERAKAVGLYSFTLALRHIWVQVASLADLGAGDRFLDALLRIGREAGITVDELVPMARGTNEPLLTRVVWITSRSASGHPADQPDDLIPRQLSESGDFSGTLCFSRGTQWSTYRWSRITGIKMDFASFLLEFAGMLFESDDEPAWLLAPAPTDAGKYWRGLLFVEVLETLRTVLTNPVDV